MRAVLDERGQDLAALRKENAELRRRLGVTERLIRLLRELPEAKARSLLQTPEAERPEAIRRAGGKKAARPRVDASGRDGAAAGGGSPPSG